MSVSRKDFLAANAAAAAAALIAAEAPRAAAAAALPAPLLLSFDPHDPNIVYDLVVTGGTVLDPSQKLDAKRDVAMKNGQIAALLAPGTVVKSVQTIDASGNLVTPGLVDMHCHYYHQVSGIGLPADEMMHLTMTTTGVDAGDAGSSTFSGFRHFVIGQARTRHFAFVHIASIGLAGDPIKIGELFNIDYADVEKCAKTVAENRDVVLGVKVRLSKNVVGNNGIEPLRRAIKAAEIAGPWARVMAHIGNCDAPLADVLDMMRPGDIITHCYSGARSEQHRRGWQTLACGATREETWRALRRRPRGRQLRRHDREAGNRSGPHARHDFERRPQREHSVAVATALPQRRFEISRTRLLARRGHRENDERTGQDHRSRTGPRNARDRCARGYRDFSHRRRSDHLRRHEQTQFFGRPLSRTGQGHQRRPTTRTPVSEPVYVYVERRAQVGAFEPKLRKRGSCISLTL